MSYAVCANRIIGRKMIGLWPLLGFALISFIGSSAFGAITRDANVSTDQTTSSISTAPFSTGSANELLLAFVATDYLSGLNTTVTGVSGGGLNWVLVRRTNVQSGTSEIWRAFASTALSNATVTATISQSLSCSLTVMSFTGVDTTGTSGSGAIGATATANSTAGGSHRQPHDDAQWLLGDGCRE